MDLFPTPPSRADMERAIAAMQAENDAQWYVVRRVTLAVLRVLLWPALLAAGWLLGAGAPLQWLREAVCR